MAPDSVLSETVDGAAAGLEFVAVVWMISTTVLGGSGAVGAVGVEGDAGSCAGA